ncbi:MAG: enoyl-CoA hydratase/isomerase family protein [Balneolaceae bacterium]|nr:MAG: enoyl-CoA hydratase/isomerase family protein [Balneolaceae bacterium]
MPLQITREECIVTATINRPKARNAINFELMDQLESLLDELERDDTIRLFILTGSGKSFISGGDLREFHQIKDAEGAKSMTRRMLSILARIEALPCWTLAAINGHTYGGGWEMMLSFDFRVASSDARFGFTQGAFYLPPGWGGLKKLNQTVGKNRALFLLASQQVITADEALQNGLIHKVFSQKKFSKELSSLKTLLTANDRAYINYLKQNQGKAVENEIEPFSKFWENKEHLKRVDDFLNRNKA